jgi:predicted nucleotidyltransferase
MAEKMQKRLKTLITNLKAYQPEKIILFGSSVRGEQDEYSDIDLVIIKKTQDRFLQRLKKAALLIREPIPVDLFVYTPEEFAQMLADENSFAQTVIKEGKIIYEKPHR